MKRILFVMILMLLLCSCGAKEEEVPVEIKEEETVEEVKEFSSEAYWVVLPGIKAKEAVMLEGVPSAGFTYRVERTGHPQEWDYTAGFGPIYVSENEYYGPMKYTSDAVLLANDRGGRILDYEGNLLCGNASSYSYYPSFGGFEAEGDFVHPSYKPVYSSDFIGMIYRPVLDGLCGGYLDIIDYKGSLYTDIPDPYHSDLKDITSGCGFMDVDLEKDYQLSKADTSLLFGHRSCIPSFDRYLNQTGLAIYDEKGKKLFDIPYEGYYVNNFVNGFIEYWNEDSGVAFYSAEKQDFICDFEYEQILPFVEGYAAVKKNNKWAYMDENGKIVTDFIWDSVSAPYEGKAYVGLKDRFGVLDLKRCLKEGIILNYENCYGSPDEEEAYQNVLTIEEIKPEQKQRKAEAIEEDEKYMEAYQAIGALTPITKNIRIRNKPSTSGEKLGVLKPLYDDDDTYFMTLLFYETAENDGYTWYRIGKDRWVADNGSWFEVGLFEGQ